MQMPALLVIRNFLFMIHTRDHGFPHVTIYQGSPEKYEAMAKVRLDNMEVLEVRQFTKRDMGLILKITARYQTEWMEVWNEIFKDR
jgi:hypothetical protein